MTYDDPKEVQKMGPAEPSWLKNEALFSLDDHACHKGKADRALAINDLSFILVESKL